MKNDVEPNRAGGRRAAQKRADLVRACVAAALRDFEVVGRPSMPVRLLGLRAHNGHPVAMIGAGERVHRLRADKVPRLIAQTALLAQSLEEKHGRPWPTIPTLGLLRPSIRHGRAVWQTAGGDILCDVGHLFEPSAR